ncbi:MAG TPA: hypothetical protein G4N96_02325 [Chloroflexi bacterium]|nr:MAG: hypothetical protein B6243_06220 [Anaerolineaceae bacterium 4572_5.2]HEY83940.1 hypothetical protein [Chloroflexota bacterium]
MTVQTASIKQAEQLLHLLSPERLQSVVDFMNYLYERERWEATEELEAIPGFIDGFERAKQQVRNNDVVRFEDIRRNV